MIGAATHPKSSGAAALTLVWVDAREAVVMRRADGLSTFERIESDVPAHHRATGHVRHDPGMRHGGGGPPQTAGEPHRLEHLARFLDAVAARLPPDEDLLVIGPGTVREQLARRVAEDAAQHRVVRDIRCERAAAMTHRQLAALLRQAAGDQPRRRTVGAYRWTDSPPRDPPGRRTDEPRRVLIKRPRPAAL